MINHIPWLTTMVLFPILGSALFPILPGKGNRIIRWYTLGICILEFLLILYIFYCKFHMGDQSFQLIEKSNWINSIDFHWALGIDGLSMGLVLLTGFVTTLAALAAWPITQNIRLFYFLMLAMYTGQIGLFVSRDILLFFLMWELELVPIYILLCLWGGKRRLYSATKFILYTAGGSIFLLVGSFAMSFYGAEMPSFNIQDLANRSYPMALEVLFYLGFLIAYAIKLPIFPLHTWLPDTHSEAHYSTSMLLAGVLLKMGGYGLIRINMELLPNAHSIFALWLVLFGAFQIVYAALISSSQHNLKRRIAYSSISHMGFVMIGIGCLRNIGLNGAVLQMISHGLIGAALFFVAGTCYDRTRTYYLAQLGGIAIQMPRIFAMFTIFSMASLALPGMSGFISELMVLLGVVTNKTYSFLFKLVVTIFSSIGIILTPIYLLSMLRRIFYGYRISNYSNPYLIDFGPREIFISICFFLPILGIGLYPDVVLSLWNKKIISILSQYSSLK